MITVIKFFIAALFAMGIFISADSIRSYIIRKNQKVAFVKLGSGLVSLCAAIMMIALI